MRKYSVKKTRKSIKNVKTRKAKTRKTKRNSLGKRRFFSLKMRGGDQPALIGSPYTPTNLPGQAGIAGVSNYYPYNNYTPFDPQTQNIIQERDQTTLGVGMRMRGGKLGGKKHMKMKRGGGFLPQDMVNFGRNITFGLGSAYNAFNGYSAPVNPMPYNDQLTRQISYL